LDGRLVHQFPGLNRLTADNVKRVLLCRRARRVRRILPALIFVMLIICLLGWVLLDAKEYFFVGATATSSFLAISNFSLWRLQDYFATEAQLRPVLMTWSLGIEEQFYLLFPLMISGIVRFAPGRA
jgi:peptidoglycan/LPS O-acetylase OafA/YrhL